jgi:hypothetical protein
MTENNIIDIKKPKKAYSKKPCNTSKTAKYFFAKQTSKTKEEAKNIAQYRPSTTTTSIEKTKTYQAIEQKYLKDHLLDKITPEQWSSLLIRNAEQDKDKGASNKALEMISNKLEPDNQDNKIPDNIIVVFKDNKLEHKE